MASLASKQQMNFFLSKSLVFSLNGYVPKGKQSQFVEKSLEAALSSFKFQNALKKSFGSWKGHPRNTEQFVRSLRHSNRLSFAK